MARFVYKEDTVKNSISRLQDAYAALSQTEAALNSGFDYLQQVQGGAYIDVAQSRNTICGFPESGRSYINELKNAVESKCAEIQDYNNAPWYKKLFASIGMGLAKFGEGFINAFENIGDACISLVGFTSGVFGMKGVQDWCAEQIKKDYASDIMSNVYKDGTFIGKYSVFSANGTFANIIKGFGTAAGYMTIGKIGGFINSKVDPLLSKININIGETGINSIAAAAGGLGSGTETALIQGRTFNESFFQGLKVGTIQGTAAYLIGKFGDQYAKENANYLAEERKNLMLEKNKIMNDGTITESVKSGKLAEVNDKLAKVDKKIKNYTDRLEKVGSKDDTHGKTTQKIDKIDDLDILQDDNYTKFNNRHKYELTKSGDQVSITSGELIENNPDVQKYIAGSKASNLTATSSEVGATGSTIAGNGGFWSNNGLGGKAIGTVKAIPSAVVNKVVSNPAASLQVGTISAGSIYNTSINTEAKVHAQELAQQAQPAASILPRQNGANAGYGNSSSNSTIASSVGKSAQSAYSSNTNQTYTGHVINVATQKTGTALQEAIKTETNKYTNKTSTANTVQETPVAEPSHNTGSGGRSFGTTSSGSTSTYTPASSLATSIGTIKSTNTKPTTTTTTTTTTKTTTDSGSKVGGLATGPSTEQPTYQYPTSTTVVGGTNKYPVNKPQIEGSLAQNNVSTTTLGSSGSTHGGGGYSGSGYSFSGSSAVTSDGTIGEQDTKGTLASSITKNKSNKTDTIRISDADEEEIVEEKANNYVIPTSAALSAAAAAGIGAKIIMDKKDKDKEEEQEESDEDYEIISSDFDNFETDFDDTNNDYEVVESN